MKHLKTYEDHREKLLTAKETKNRFSEKLAEYMSKFYSNSMSIHDTVFVSHDKLYTDNVIYIFKEQKKLLTVWPKDLIFSINILLEWFKKEGILIQYKELTHTYYQLFFNVDYLDKILETIDKLINSGEIEYQINISKYNL